MLLLVFSYYFGKNKVHEKPYRWQVLQSEHFDIYFYQGERQLAQFAADVLEEAYDEYADFFPKVPEDPVPVIIYSSGREFQRTNVIPEILEEGVGGFTEIFKKRVVVPFEGSWSQFRHVLRHELVHVFQYLLLERAFGFGLYAAQQVPLWVMEGSAEFLSAGWDTEAEAYMRDAVINGWVVPLDYLANYGGYLVYKEGQAAMAFIEERWGREALKKLIGRIGSNQSFSKSVEDVLGVKLEDLAEEFAEYNKKRYYGLVRDFSFPTDSFRRLTDHTKDRSWMNLAPTLSPKGDRLAVMSDRDGYTSVYLVSLSDGKFLKRLLKGQRTPDAENLHLVRPGMSFSPTGDSLAIVAQGTGCDILHIVDVNKGKTVKKIPLKGLDAAYTPAWGPRGIAVVGVKDGWVDLWLVDLPSGKLKRLTNDPFEERDPVFCGDTLLYASDKGQGDFRYGSYAVFQLVEGSETRLTPYFPFVGWPRKMLGGVVFVGDYRGSRNLLLWRGDTLYLLTDILTMITGFSAADSVLAISALWEGGYDIFVRQKPLKPVKVLGIPEAKPYTFDQELYASAPVKPYRLKLSLDWLMGGMSYSSAYGAYGSVTLGFSDMLGDFQAGLVMDAYSQDIENTNFYTWFLWLPGRVDWELNLFQWWNVYPYSSPDGLSLDSLIWEKELGASLTARFPFNKFQRAELGLGYSYLSWFHLVYSQGYFFLTGEEYPQRLQAYGGLVHDDALIDWVIGPLDGKRLFLGAWASVPNFGLQQKLLWADLRRYFHITPRSVWAWRLAGGKSWGPDALPLWIGGPTTLRGYDDFQFTGDQVFYLNSELRVPFIDKLKLGFFPLELEGLRGVVFLDLGAAIREGEPFVPFEDWRLRDLKAGVGAGLRFFLYYFTLKIDFARRTDFSKLLGPQDDGLPWTWITYITFGTDW